MENKTDLGPGVQSPFDAQYQYPPVNVPNYPYYPPQNYPLHEAPNINSRFNPNMCVVDRLEGAGSSVQIEEYISLRGNLGTPDLVYQYERLGRRLRRIKIDLKGSTIMMEAGCLHYMTGNIKIALDNSGVSGYLSNVLKSMANNEKAVKPKYSGVGEIYLEPTYNHYLLIYLNNELCVVDRGMYVACESTVTVGLIAQKNLKTGVLGGEGFFQTRLEGKGWVVLDSKVPREEIHKFVVDETHELKVDGNFAILRKGNIDFVIESATGSYISGKMSGEGRLQTFRGKGEVWICPTVGHYPTLPYG